MSEEPKLLSPDQLLEKAREIHQHIYDEVDSAASSIAIVGIIFTNMLTAARLSGAEADFIGQILVTVKDDVEAAVEEVMKNNSVN